jgi:hypothetical protein
MVYLLLILLLLILLGLLLESRKRTVQINKTLEEISGKPQK